MWDNSEENRGRHVRTVQRFLQITLVHRTKKSLRIVHSLEPLNAVTIAHSRLTPVTDDLAVKFAGRACGGMFDLYVGYDERLLSEESRDLTMFQMPYN